LYRAPTPDPLDQKAALDRSEQRRPIERDLPLEVRYAVVQVSRRPTERGDQLEGSAGTPIVDARRHRRSRNRERDAASRLRPSTVKPDRGDTRTKAHGSVSLRRIFDERRADGERIVSGTGSDRPETEAPKRMIERGAEWRVERSLACLEAEHQ
jgi:hypothetical protein